MVMIMDMEISQIKKFTKNREVFARRSLHRAYNCHQFNQPRYLIQKLTPVLFQLTTMKITGMDMETDMDMGMAMMLAKQHYIFQMTKFWIIMRWTLNIDN